MLIWARSKCLVDQSDCLVGTTCCIIVSTGFHYEDIRTTICTFGWFIDSRGFLVRHQHSHLHCHCVLCSTRITVVCRSLPPASPNSLSHVTMNIHTHDLDRWAVQSECFSWLADMAEDPSRDGILKPHHQHICDPQETLATREGLKALFSR